MIFGGGSGIEARNLIIIEDQMRREALAARKSELYAASFADPALKSCAAQLAKHHRDNFFSLLQYLDAHR
jgi:hypothetical protein